MGTMNQPVISTPDTRHYRRYSIEFKLSLVKQTLQDGASVLSSPFGHDAFLLEAPELNRVVDGFLRAGE